MKRIIFSGDRNSFAIRIGKLLRRIFGNRFVGIKLWDGYKSRVYLETNIAL